MAKSKSLIITVKEELTETDKELIKKARIRKMLLSRRINQNKKRNNLRKKTLARKKFEKEFSGLYTFNLNKLNFKEMNYN